jgi:hypothetical protein
MDGSLRYPIGVAESQGAVIGNDLVVVSGFLNNQQ